MEKILNVDIFEIIYPLWQFQNLYINHKLLIFWDYFKHKSAIYVLNVAFISPLSHPYIINIFQSFEFGKFSKKIHILNCGFSDCLRWYHPFLDCSHKRLSSDDQKVFLKINWDWWFFKVKTIPLIKERFLEF